MLSCSAPDSNRRIMVTKEDNNLKDLRTSRDITQESLADTIGVSRQTIISIEKGKYTPSVSLALKIARHFKVKVEDIFN